MKSKNSGPESSNKSHPKNPDLTSPDKKKPTLNQRLKKMALPTILSAMALIPFANAQRNVIVSQLDIKNNMAQANDLGSKSTNIRDQIDLLNSDNAVKNGQLQELNKQYRTTFAKTLKAGDKAAGIANRNTLIALSEQIQESSESLNNSRQAYENLTTELPTVKSQIRALDERSQILTNNLPEQENQRNIFAGVGIAGITAVTLATKFGKKKPGDGNGLNQTYSEIPVASKADHDSKLTDITQQTSDTAVGSQLINPNESPVNIKTPLLEKIASNKQESEKQRIKECKDKVENYFVFNDYLTESGLLPTDSYSEYRDNIDQYTGRSGFDEVYFNNESIPREMRVVLLNCDAVENFCHAYGVEVSGNGLEKTRIYEPKSIFESRFIEEIIYDMPFDDNDPEDVRNQRENNHRERSIGTQEFGGEYKDKPLPNKSLKVIAFLEELKAKISQDDKSIIVDKPEFDFDYFIVPGIRADKITNIGTIRDQIDNNKNKVNRELRNAIVKIADGKDVKVDEFIESLGNDVLVNPDKLFRDYALEVLDQTDQIKKAYSPDLEGLSAALEFINNEYDSRIKNFDEFLNDLDIATVIKPFMKEPSKNGYTDSNEALGKMQFDFDEHNQLPEFNQDQCDIINREIAKSAYKILYERYKKRYLDS